MARSLQFGIPSIDKMLRFGSPDIPEKMALLGPDGTGKSIIGLHLAAHYCAARDEKEDGAGPLVLYVSTDMELPRATAIWRAFALDIPGLRAVPMETFRRREEREGLQNAKLRPLTPCDSADLSAYLAPEEASSTGSGTVGFLDLASTTAGDDWSFVARLLKLGAPRGTQSALNLMVIDSVAGFETLVGPTDAFGREASRRDRIAQFIRAAAGHWHLVFIVEDPKPGEHSPEEFVTDTVIRLRRDVAGLHVRLTLEIEKSRSNAHPRGQHPFEIRNGEGTCTGHWQDADDPRAVGPETRTNAYLEVFPSLHQINQSIARSTWRLPENYAPPGKVCGFGIEYLDNMLAPHQDDLRFGLSAGSVTALLGDDGTHKSLLGRRFLMGCFRAFFEAMQKVLECAAECSELSSVEELWTRARRMLPEGACIGRPSPTKLDELVEDIKKIAWTRDLASKCYEGAFVARRRAKGDALTDDEIFKMHFEARLRPGSIKVGSEPWMRLIGHLDRGHRESFQKELIPFLSIENYNWVPHKWDPDIPRTRVRYPDDWISFACPVLGSLELKLVEIVCWLFRHPAFVEPAVLLTTLDERAGILARQYASHSIRPLLNEVDKAREAEVPKREKLTSELNGFGEGAFDMCWRNMAGHLICRRLPKYDAPAPVLVHIVEKSIDEAMQLRFGRDSEAVTRLDLSAERAYKTRVVMDDLRVAAGTLSDLKNDELLLPYVVFRLQRRGVTGLLIGTYPGRPDTQPSDVIDAALRTLTRSQIHTWKVSFYGRNRIAIAVVPAMSPDHSGVVRELEGGGRSDSMDLSVDPHFELYSGIEEGNPAPIPLEVRLFSETPAFAKYIAEEEGFWRQRFTPNKPEGVPPGYGVLRPVSAQELSDMRASCHLPNDEIHPNTLLFQVDGYWVRSGGSSLKNRHAYLTEKLPPGKTGLASGESKSIGDPFGMFRPAGGAVETPNRLSYFENFGYKSRLNPKDDRIDRVPFLWDFGFLLCREEAWARACETPLRSYTRLAHSQSPPKEDGEAGPDSGFRYRVGHVWNEFIRQTDEKLTDGGGVSPMKAFADTPPLLGDHSWQAERCLELTGWRAFFEACKLVAEAESLRLSHPVVAFDLSAISPDSICCLVLEIWFSEILRSLRASKKSDNCLLKLVSCNQTNFGSEGKYGLCYWLGKPDSESFESAFASCQQSYEETSGSLSSPPALAGNVLELYKTWLLLTEVLDFGSFSTSEPSFHFKSDRLADKRAIAARHWYKTACFQQAEDRGSGEQENHRPVPLPGHFTVRGDWFMAVAEGSRSERLADLALDILSSRRGNTARLQAGLGLPVRDLLAGQACKEIRTPILKSRNPNENASYQDIVRLGGRHQEPEESDRARKDLYWFWRCGLAGYDRHSRVWQSWLNRLFEWTVTYRFKSRADWPGGFAIYDAWETGDWRTAVQGDCFVEFARQCDVLVGALQQASRTKEPPRQQGEYPPPPDAPSAQIPSPGPPGPIPTREQARPAAAG